MLVKVHKQFGNCKAVFCIAKEIASAQTQVVQLGGFNVFFAVNELFFLQNRPYAIYLFPDLKTGKKHAGKLELYRQEQKAEYFLWVDFLA